MACPALLDPVDERRLLSRGLVVIDGDRVRLDRRVAFRRDYPADMWWPPGAFPCQTTAAKNVLPRFIGGNTETLVYLGLTRQAASELAARARRGQPDLDRAWINTALGDVVARACSSLDPATEYLPSAFLERGLSAELFHAVMDPRHKRIREQATVKFWVVMAMKSRYRQLLTIQKRSGQRASSGWFPGPEPESGQQSGCPRAAT